MSEPPPHDRAFAEGVRQCLLANPRRLEPRWFYDALGSHLFEAICHLPWYRITRVEEELIAAHAPSLLTAAGGDRIGVVVELGGGSGEKLARLLGALPPSQSIAAHLVDVSPRALELSRRTLAPLTRLRVTTHAATFEAGLDEALAVRPARAAALVLFLGSNIGNLDGGASLAFLRAIRGRLRAGDSLLLGADLIKPERELLAAYDDPLGVTAAFNKNVLLRINRELGGDFDLAAWDHQARWNGASGAVEMHLVSRAAQRVRLRSLELDVEFAAGETLWTESSHKYTPDGIAAMARTAGFARVEQWTSTDDGFALSLCAAA